MRRRIITFFVVTSAILAAGSAGLSFRNVHVRDAWGRWAWSEPKPGQFRVVGFIAGSDRGQCLVAVLVFRPPDARARDASEREPASSNTLSHRIARRWTRQWSAQIRPGEVASVPVVPVGRPVAARRAGRV